MQAKIELIDEVNVKIHNLATSTRRKLYDKFSFMLPYAYHMPAYKMGRWDGKVNFFAIGGKTYSALLEEILPILLDEGYEVDLVDKRLNYKFDLKPIKEDHFAHKVWPAGHPVEGQPVILRDYQVNAINNFLENEKSVQVIGTGAGKTLMTAALSNIIEDCVSDEDAVVNKLTTGSGGARSIVIVPNKDLVVQTEEDYINLGLDVGVYYGDRKELGRTHTICTWQSLEVISKNFKSGKSDLSLKDFAEGVLGLIVDECHGSKADVLQKLLTGPFANIPIRWGLTGTIPKEDHFATAIKIGIGPVCGKLASSELQDRGILSSCNIEVVQLQDDIHYNSYQSEMKYLVSDDERIEYMANFIKSITDDKNTLVLFNNISTGEKLVEAIGIDDLVFVSGKDKTDQRKKEYDKFKEGTNKIVLASYGVASTGINLIRINNLVLIEPGKSFVRVIQSIGRGLRKGHDKDHIDIFDMCSSAKYSKRHLTERKKFYREANYPFRVTKVDWKSDNSRIAEIIDKIKKEKED